ncbi:hypothetical protein L7F22_055141 [Adiantum nelumboides]|nr:hypothetical protein [Adiantum nelumboides]
MESLTPMVNYILEGEFPKEFTTEQRRKLVKHASTFLWLEGALYQKGKDLVCRRVPSTTEIPKILKGLHEEACGGHFSHELTLKKILLAGYVWPSMHADVQHWCRSYNNCQVNGNKRLLYGPRQEVIANGPFEKWGIDAMGPLPRTTNGKLYILVAIDYMTRWVEAQRIARVNEKTVSKFVYTHICCRFGTPLEIVSDNGPRFRKGFLTEVCEELKISHRHSTPYYPQSNGLVEKANGIIAGIIRKMVESKPKHWDNFLDGAIWAYITTYRDATQFTPFHLVYGQEALQPIELNIPTIKLTGRQEQNNDEAWIDRLLSLVELEWKREAAYHCYERKALQLKDKLNEGFKDKEIKEKSLVLRYNNALDNRFDAKFEHRWEGPFIVKKDFTGGYYHLMDLNGKEHPRKVNGYRLNPYLNRILPAVFETKQISKKTKKVLLEDVGALLKQVRGQRHGFNIFSKPEGASIPSQYLFNGVIPANGNYPAQELPAKTPDGAPSYTQQGEGGRTTLGSSTEAQTGKLTVILPAIQVQKAQLDLESRALMGMIAEPCPPVDVFRGWIRNHWETIGVEVEMVQAYPRTNIL